MGYNYIYKIANLLQAYDGNMFDEALDLQFVKALNYDAESYKELAEAIGKDGVRAVINFPVSRQKTFEDISFFSFTDRSGKKYLVSIYDSDELMQDPLILDVFKL